MSEMILSDAEFRMMIWFHLRACEGVDEPPMFKNREDKRRYVELCDRGLLTWAGAISQQGLWAIRARSEAMLA